MHDDQVVRLPRETLSPIASWLLKFQSAIQHRLGMANYLACHEVFDHFVLDLESHGATVLDRSQRALLRARSAGPEPPAISALFGEDVCGRFLELFASRVAAGSIAMSPQAHLLAPAVIERIARLLVYRGSWRHVLGVLDADAIDAQADASAAHQRRLLKALRESVVPPHEGRRGEYGEHAIGRIEAGAIWLEPMIAEDPIGPIALPEATVALCREDWIVLAEICHCDGLHLLSVDHVAPFRVRPRQARD